MKILRNLSLIAMFAYLVTAVSCGGDDEPTQPDDVEDLESPVVTISSPADGSKVSSLDATTSVPIKFTVTDDVELASVVVDFEGTQVAEITTFTDFRNYTGEVEQEEVGDGTYTITVTATDLSGKSTSETSTFEKVTSNPYTPLDNEVFYMAFEGNYLESVSEEEATVVGSPEFAGEGKEGDNAYKGAADSYLTFGTENLQSSVMTASFFMKVNNDPERAGILTMSPEDPDNPELPNNRTSGFRFFREARGDNQLFKLNFGTGDTDVYLDGGDLATIDPTVDAWHHFAFIIDETTAALYIDGVLVSSNDEHVGMSLAGCDILSIMSGEPRYTEWNHKSDLSYLDELKIFNKALTEAELEAVSGVEITGEPEESEWNPDPELEPVDGPDAEEIMYMSFDTDFSIEGLEATATEVGSPTIADGGVSGKAYQGAVDSYLTIPTDGLLNDEFSASFWIKVNNTPDRAGILVIGPPDPANTEVQNNRNSGVRLFRENAAGDQRFKLNIGNGAADSYADGGEYADIPGDVTEWRHVAFTVSASVAQVYLNGILVAKSEYEGLDWTDCDILSFGSGAPRFTEWNHLSDESLFDELRIYKGILNPAQIAALKAAGE